MMPGRPWIGAGFKDVWRRLEYTSKFNSELGPDWQNAYFLCEFVLRQDTSVGLHSTLVPRLVASWSPNFDDGLTKACIEL